MGHIRDVYTEPVTLLRLFQRDRIVEILRFLTIDRDCRQIAQILASRLVLLADGIRDLFKLSRSIKYRLPDRSYVRECW